MIEVNNNFIVNWTYLTPCSSVFIVNFEHVEGWVILFKATCVKRIASLRLITISKIFTNVVRLIILAFGGVDSTLLTSGIKVWLLCIKNTSGNLIRKRCEIKMEVDSSKYQPPLLKRPLPTYVIFPPPFYNLLDLPLRGRQMKIIPP